MEHLISIIVSVLASIFTGLMLFFIQRYFKKADARAEKEEARREKKDVLMLKSLRAIGELTVANAIAVKEGKQNGEMHKAMVDFEVIDKELDDFLIHATVKSMKK